MIDFFSLSKPQQRLVIEQVQSGLGIPLQAIEKDLWVTCVLQILFSVDLKADVVFKGGTSLSKMGNLIERFSEDIDIAINPAICGFEGNPTKKQLKNLRKSSSLYVKNDLSMVLQSVMEKYGLNTSLIVMPEPDGIGDSTYPEPRKIFIEYQSLFPSSIDYLQNRVVLEVGMRSLMEPTENIYVKSLISSALPDVNTSVVNPIITTASPQKTFLEKVCLLHELFSAKVKAENADRRSRHLYDLERMMDMDFAINSLRNNELWDNIQHHRSIFTSVAGVDYSVDFRKYIVLCPPESVLSAWKNDYRQMCETMIYGEKLPFERLIERIRELEDRFHNL